MERAQVSVAGALKRLIMETGMMLSPDFYNLNKKIQSSRPCSHHQKISFRLKNLIIIP